tara:strand:+ start:3066 stop:3272 length:207 start_codon:yes stop_codon:yes gene_type:complete
MDDTSRYTAREVKEMLERKDAQLLVLKSKNSKQNSELARLSVKLERVTKDKQGLLADIKWMRGAKNES